MPESKSTVGGNGVKKRQLPSWMSGGDEENGPSEKSPDGGRDEAKGKPAVSSDFSKIMDGVVFVLSGFVNPERSTLRSQAMAMGAEYRADWGSGCTLLICAFPNTPKFRQVQADCGTIVAKEWILACYQQKKLVDIDTYMMHAGKPWRICNNVHEASHAKEIHQPRNADKVVKKQTHQRSTAASSSKKASSAPVNEFSPSVVKQWVKDDLEKTISWLQSQEEKPEAAEMNDIAGQGILTCLQDAIDLLLDNQDIGKLMDQWSCIPRVVKELENATTQRQISNEDLCRLATNFKQIYESELNRLAEESLHVEKKARTGKDTHTNRDKVNVQGDDAGYDSDDTVEMTEEEIDMAYKLATS